MALVVSSYLFIFNFFCLLLHHHFFPSAFHWYVCLILLRLSSYFSNPFSLKAGMTETICSMNVILYGTSAGALRLHRLNCRSVKATYKYIYIYIHNMRGIELNA